MRIKLFEQFVFEILNEGGKVFDDTSKIKKEHVDATVSDIEKNLFPIIGVNVKNVIRIGSSGHADISGDIDFGIIGIPFEDLYETLKDKFLNNEVNFIKGLEVLSISWPISGTDSLVQVDMIPVYHEAWTKFVYKYPEESSYKSAHRNWLLMSILASIKNNLEVDEETDKPLEYDGYMMNLNKGLYSIKKDYHGKTKILKHGEIVKEKLITSNPDEFVEFVFGKGIDPEDVGTFEKCWSIINKSDFKWSSKLEDIKKNLEKFLLRVELPIPTELK